MNPAGILPKHVAITMDGNGRWAKKRLLPRNAGHKAGADALDKLCRKMNEAGFEYLTVFAFSTENWTRSPDEVAGLMDLLRKHIQQYIDGHKTNNMRLRVIGDVLGLDADIRGKIRILEEKTAEHMGMTVTFAINYGGRDELVRAVRLIARDVKNGLLNPSIIDANTIAQRLDTADLPDPDLWIRTSGEMRFSNFMLWQCAYTEFYFGDKLWPDFTFDDLMAAVETFRNRERRYGGRV